MVVVDYFHLKRKKYADVVNLGALQIRELVNYTDQIGFVGRGGNRHTLNPTHTNIHTKTSAFQHI